MFPIACASCSSPSASAADTAPSTKHANRKSIRIRIRRSPPAASGRRCVRSRCRVSVDAELHGRIPFWRNDEGLIVNSALVNQVKSRQCSIEVLSRIARRRSQPTEDSMGFDTIIKNGSVVTATDTYTADVAIANGKITAIGTDSSRAERDEDFGRVGQTRAARRHRCAYASRHAFRRHHQRRRF